MNSILDSIKKLVDDSPDDSEFDFDILTQINMAFSTLSQVCGFKSFFITNNQTTWDDYSTDPNILGLVKTYVQLKVKLVFDPPSSSVVMNAYSEQIKELEWRLHSIGNYQGGDTNG